jgi:hypothetical protein
MEAARAERLGHKWTCFSCSTRFYDLAKTPIVCPRCGKDQKDAPPTPPPAAKPKRKATRASKPKRTAPPR